MIPILSHVYLTFCTNDGLFKDMKARKEYIDDKIKNAEKLTDDQRNVKFEEWFQSLLKEDMKALNMLGDIVGYAQDWDFDEIEEWTKYFEKITDRDKKFSELKENMLDQNWNTLDIWNIY